MNIEPKFQLGERVFALSHTTITEYVVIGVIITIGSEADGFYDDKGKAVYTGKRIPFAPEIKYRLARFIHESFNSSFYDDVFNEDSIFRTREELLQKLSVH